MTSKELNVLWCSAHPSLPTGYGKVSFELITNLLYTLNEEKKELVVKRPDLHITHYSLFSVLPEVDENATKFCRPVIHSDNISYSNYCTNQDQMGLNNFKEQVKQSRPDIIFIYNGIGEIITLLNAAKSIIPSKTKVIIYYDSYYEGMYKDMAKILNENIHECIVFSEFQKDKCIKAGVTIPIHILGHGINPNAHKHVPQLEAKLNIKLEPVHFICSTLNRNQPRKRYDVLLQAWAKFCKNWCNTYIVKHTNMLESYKEQLQNMSIEDYMKSEHANEMLKYRIPLLVIVCKVIDTSGWDIVNMAQRCFIDEFNVDEDTANKLINKHIAFIDTSKTTYSDENVNMLNCATDLGINVADGEGVGLIPLEQSYVGTPQLIGNFSAGPLALPPNENITDLDIDNPKGIVLIDHSIKLMASFKDESSMEYKFILNPDDVSNALMKLYENPEYLVKSRDILRKYYTKNTEKHDWSSLSDKLFNIFLNVTTSKEDKLVEPKIETINEEDLIKDE